MRYNSTGRSKIALSDINLLGRVILLAIMLPWVSIIYSKDTAKFFLKVDCPSSAYVNQYIPYELNLYSETPDISNIETVIGPDFSSLDVINGQSDKKAKQVKENGISYWKWNVGRVFISSSTPGTVKISGGKYNVLLPHEVVKDDFFFGLMRTMEYQRIHIDAPDAKIKFKSLPEFVTRKGMAVGEFSVVSWLPPGEISSGNEAIAIVKISGEGLLKNAEIPNLHKAFDKDCKLKNIDRKDNVSQQNGRLHSEIILECRFVPMVEKGEIGAFTFTYFDVKTGKEKTVSSEPQPWNNEDEYTPVDKSKLKILGI